MILEVIIQSFFSGLGSTVLGELMNLRREKNEAKLRDRIRHELEELKHSSASVTITDTDAVIDEIVRRLKTNELPSQPGQTRAFELNKRGRHNEALAACEQALRSDPKDAVAYVNKGWALIKLGRPQEALSACEQAINLHPYNIDIRAAAYSNTGWAVNALGQHEEAFDASEQAIHLHPSGVDVQATAYVNKSWALNALGRRREAFDASEQAIHLHPNDVNILNAAYQNKRHAQENA